jgi:hypothetical protein
MVIVDVPAPEATEAGLKEAEAPLGNPEAVKFTVPVKPFTLPTVTVEVVELPAVTVPLVGEVETV